VALGVERIGAEQSLRSGHILGSQLRNARRVRIDRWGSALAFVVQSLALVCMGSQPPGGTSYAGP